MLGLSALAKPFCTAPAAPAAYGRSLCSQGRAAAPRRQLFLAQVVEMCTSYAWNRFCQQMQQAMAISAHPMCGHCLFQWSWVLAALPQRDTSKGFGRVNCVIAGLPASLQGNTLRVAACLLGCTRAASSSVLVCGTQAAASCSRAVTASRSSSQAASSDSALLSTCWQGPLRTRS